jgi:hypothetical protein
MKALTLFLAASLWATYGHGSSTTHYVDQANQAPISPYTNWLSAATNIQDAVNASDSGDLVLVTNGLYQFGGAYAGKSFASNRVALTKPIMVQSVNGPAETTILGSQGNTRGIPYVRCAYLTNDASLIGFTLTNGAVPVSSSGSGGGAYADSTPLFQSTATVSNCVLAGNSAAYGGGAYGVILNNCLLTANSANAGGGACKCILNNCIVSNNTANGDGTQPGTEAMGGGAYTCTLNNCDLTANVSTATGGGASLSKLTNCLIAGNSAVQGGGISGGRLYNCTIASNTATAAGGVYPDGATILTNCIVFRNSATNSPNYQFAPSFSHCCTTPLPAGPGNFTNDPAFANPAASDFHLQTNSPCINAGINSAATSTTDLDGNPRIAGGTVDIGAYEFQTPASAISYAWLQQYGLATDGSADALDTDGDGMNNWQEWRAGTDPTDPSSVLRISSISATGSVATLRWQSVSGIPYTLEFSTNLLPHPAFLPAVSNIAGIGATIACPYTNPAGSQQVFFRLRVQ